MAEIKKLLNGMINYYGVVKKTCLAIFSIVLISSNSFGQTTLAEWNFDTQVRTPTTSIANNSTKTVDVVGANGYSYVTGATSDALTANAWSGGELGGGTEKYWQIEINATGYGTIALSSKQAGDLSSPEDFRVQYKIGSGGTWTNIPGLSDLVLQENNWTVSNISNFGLPAAVDDQGSIFIRWVMLTGDGINDPGFIDDFSGSYIDDIKITGFSTPGTSLVDFSTSNSPVGSSLNQNTIDNIIYIVELDVTVAEASLTSVEYVSSGDYISGDVTNFKLYINTTSSLSGATNLQTLPATAATETLTFDSFTAQTIPAGETRFLITTVDIPSGASIGNTAGISSTTLTNYMFSTGVTRTGESNASGTFDIIACVDEDGEIRDTVQPIAGVISSIANDAGSAVPVMRFRLRDRGTCDGLPTKIQQIIIQPTSGVNVGAWSNYIAGIDLKNYTTTSSIPFSSTTITDTEITIGFNDGQFNIADGTIENVELLVYLSDLNELIENTVLSFSLLDDPANVTVFSDGSSPLNTYANGDIISENFTVDVVATQLEFDSQPINTNTFEIMATDVSVEATDANGNVDIDHTTDVALSSTGTMTGDPISVTPISGIAQWQSAQPAEQIVHTVGGLGLTLSATSGALTDGVSDLFDIIQTADHLTFVSVPSAGQVGVNLASFTVEGRLPNETVDASFIGDVTISINSGPGNISGTFTQTSVAGVATFNDISFDAVGNYTLLAQSTNLTDDISENIAIVGIDDSVFPNGVETMNTAASSPSTIAEHEAVNGFINTGALTFGGGGAANEADIRNTSISSGYTGASGGANVWFTSTSGEYGFAMAGIDASTYTNLTLQFAVRKENASGTDFASLAVEYWDGDSWEVITITDYPLNGDGTGWKLLNPVILPQAAEISDLAIRWVKTGTIACRIDDVSLTGTPKAATNLIVATINGGLSPVSGAAFDVDISVQDVSGSPANVLDDTNVELSIETGNGDGTLGGTLTATVLAGTNTAVISGVTYDVQVATDGETGVIITASSISGDNLIDGVSSPFNVLATEPPTSASGFTVVSRSTNSLEISWTNGDGSDRIVVLKDTTAVDQLPVDGTSYTANPDFELGEDIGDGNIVVFAGSGSTVTVTNLQPNNIEYHFAIFEYNSSLGLENYKQADPAIGSALTTCDDPITEATSYTFTNISQNSIDLSWTDGDGAGRIVLMNSTNSFTDPIDGDDSYVADPNWNDAGEQVVYFASGTGIPVAITNLSPATNYYFRVYEFNCSGSDIIYKTDVVNTGSSVTLLYAENFTTCPPSGWSSVLIAGDQFWQCDDINGYAFASGIGSSAASDSWYITPTIDFSVLADEKMTFNSWTGGTDNIHPGLTVMYSADYSGSGNPYVADWDTLAYNVPAENSQVWTSSDFIDLSIIPDGTAYIGFRYNTSGTTAGSATEWRIDDIEIFEQSCITPTLQASNLSFTTVAQDNMTVSWTKGDGIGRIVVANSTGPVTLNPSGEYGANSDFSSATDLGGGDKVVYSGGSDSFVLTGLTPNTTYYIAIYEFSCNGANRTYLAPALTGSQVTLNPNGSDIVINGGYVYNTNIDYVPYNADISLTTGTTIDMVGYTIQDEGFINGTNSDGSPTELTDITFSTNGSTSIRAAGIFLTDGTRIAEKLISGDTTFVLDSFENTLIAPSDGSVNFELRVTFEDNVLDNEQVVFTITNATANPLTSLFADPDAGGAESINTGGIENRIEVIATSLKIVQGPSFSVPIDEDFTIEVEAIDGRNSRDLDKDLSISNITGNGTLSSNSGLTISQPLDSTALWTDLVYNTEELTEFEITDGETTPLTISTGTLQAKPRFTIFTFTGATGTPASFPPDYEPVNVSISEITRGTGISAASVDNAFSASGWPNTLDADSYYEITISTITGFELNISSIEFDYSRTSSGPNEWRLENSVNPSVQIGALNEGDWGTNNNEVANFSVIGASSVTFQLFGYGATDGNETWALDNIEIFGTLTDTQPPSFIATYPQYDSVAVDGFDLLVKLDEAATAHFIVQDPVLPAPSHSQVLDSLNSGDNPADAAGAISVTALDSVFYSRVSGLSGLSLYDVYFVLDDGTNLSSVISLTDVPISDTDTDLSAATQPVGTTIPSTSDNSADSVAVFSFNIDDAGTNDGAETHVTKLFFVQSGASTVGYTGVIDGVRLYNNSESLSIPISNTTIGASSLEIDIPTGGLTIGDGLSEEITLFVWLNETVPDNESIDFQIGGTGHGCETYTIGSQFDDPLTTLNSNIFTIDVDADRLYFDSYPLTVSTGFPFTVTVSAMDVNGNVDNDEASAVTLTRNLGSGLLATVASPALDPQGTLSLGTFTWSDVTYTSFGSGEFMNIIVSDDAAILLSDTTNTIEAGSVTDLIVPDGTTITLTSDQNFNDVEVQTGGILNLANGITMTLTGDMTVEGTFNDLGGTTSFIGSSRQDILGSQTITFYNLNIANSHAQGVVSRTNVNLINTLKLNADTSFDADGQGNEDWDFTLVSTPTATARIDVIEDGATLRGNVVWQRSLRTGPQGWRYVGTPIKGQTVAEWIDDVYIQGIEGYPNWWRNSNFGTYNEPTGTTGMGGYDGWVDYTQVTDNIDVGVGNKLWEWDQFYVPTLTIVNKGEPTIGDGDNDNISGTETITFPVVYTPTSFDGGGWNFYANPYPSELDWDDPEGDFVHSNVEGDAVYIWNPTAQQYGTYSSAESTLGHTRYIASGQGFFVKAIDGSAVISVSEGAKSSQNGNSFLRIADDVIARLRVKITSDNKYYDETAIVFKESATDGYDPLFDARKLSGGWVNFSTKVQDSPLLAINSMGAPRGVQSIKLDIVPYYYGKYSIDFSKFEGFDDDAIVTLRDNYLEKSTVVSISSSYDFVIDQNNPSTFGSDRFELQLLSPLKFNFEDVKAKAGQEFIVPVYADNLDDIISTQLGIGWEINALSFVAIEETGFYSMDDFQLEETEQGKLMVRNSSDSPIDLPDGTKLFSVRFKALNGQPQAQLRFEDASMRIKAFNNIDMPYSTKDLLLDIAQNTFISGLVESYAGDPITEVTIAATGDDEVESISDNIGAYSLGTFEQSTYSLAGTKVDDFKLSDLVTTSDIISSRRHILRLEEFESPYQTVAADVNGSKSVSALDLVEMRKIVLGIEEGFQSGLDWLIIPSVYDLSEDPFSFETTLDVSLADQDMDLNFKGVKVGDVDNSWTSLNNGRKSSGSLALSLEQLSLKDEVIEIPVVARDFNDISGYQFTINWDPKLLAYAGLENQALEGHFNEDMAGEGVLTTLWDETNGQSMDLENGATLFIMRFNVKDINANTQVELSSSVTEAIAFNGQLNPLSIAAVSANVNLEELRNGKLELMQNVPNPFDYSTTIDFKIPRQGKARLSVINLLGEVIFFHEKEYRPGVYRVTWNRDQSIQALTPGVYLYRLEINGQEVVKRMVIK